MNTYLKAKITTEVTDAKFEYEGSLTLDREFMERLGVKPYEQVHVNGKYRSSRIITYVLPGEKGVCEVNGGAANHFTRGDVVHLLFFIQSETPVKPIII